MTGPSAPVLTTCDGCGRSVELTLTVFRCPACAGPLTIVTEPLRELVADPARDGIWRYAGMLPPLGPVVTLGEPTTPLVAIPWQGHPSISFKLEFVLPSASFKDRGSALLVSFFAGRGAQLVLEDSSGNAGASLAGYLARAGIAAEVYAPASASAGKLAQIGAYGATLRRIPGPRIEATRAVEADLARRPEAVYAAHLWHPAFLLGMQTFGLELVAQLAGRVPDIVIAPVGSGGLLLGAHQAFARLLAGGAIDRLPRLFGIQSTACPSVANAWEGDPPAGREAEAQAAPPLAEGIVVTDPPRRAAIISAVTASGGRVLTVTDEQVLDAHAGIAAEGLLVEPTSAVAVAGLTRLLGEGAIAPTDRVIVALTGSGLKTAAAGPSPDRARA